MQVRQRSVTLFVIFFLMSGCGETKPAAELIGNTAETVVRPHEDPTGSLPSPQQEDVWYSGKYVVLSDYQYKIRILRWNGYSGVCPATGLVTKGSECVMSFDNIPWTPDATEVVWKVVDSGEVHQQRIDLTDVVPANQSGIVEYTLDASGTWSVRFVPESNTP
jgi:hypothetical protein